MFNFKKECMKIRIKQKRIRKKTYHPSIGALFLFNVGFYQIVGSL